MLKKAMIYLGLGPDEHYEGYADPIRPGHSQAARPGQYQGGPAAGAGHGTVSVASGPSPASPVLGRTVRPVNLAAGEGQSSLSDHDSESVVATSRPVEPKTMSPHAVSPDAFNDAQEIGDRFKSGQPVIVNLQAVDRDLRRRLVDFSSGLCYAMGGKMDRVADQVYLLTPADVEMSRGAGRSKIR